jgi:hypothetical protein
LPFEKFRRVCHDVRVIDLKIDEMYTAGALNTFIDELSDWIREKEAAVEKHRQKTYLAPVLADLQKHIDETKALLVKAENYLANQETAKP